MAEGPVDSTIGVGSVVLAMNQISVPATNLSSPRDGFLGADHHNVATPQFPIGTTIQVQQKGTTGAVGPVQFTYLKVGTQNPDTAIAANSVCVQEGTTPGVVTNDPDTCIALGGTFAVVAISAMTNGYYGWFWSGGVAPKDTDNEILSTPLTGNLLTDGTVIAGPVCAGDLVADAIGLTPVAAATQVASGYATATDAA